MTFKLCDNADFEFLSVLHVDQGRVYNWDISGLSVVSVQSHISALLVTCI